MESENKILKHDSWKVTSPKLLASLSAVYICKKNGQYLRITYLYWTLKVNSNSQIYSRNCDQNPNYFMGGVNQGLWAMRKKPEFENLRLQSLFFNKYTVQCLQVSFMASALCLHKIYAALNIM